MRLHGRNCKRSYFPGRGVPTEVCEPMQIPQPFQYQGSKRQLASAILGNLPGSIGRLVEPFAGSSALSIAAAAKGRARAFWLNDLNAPLTALLEAIISDPESISCAYRAVWKDRKDLGTEYYSEVRDRFNKSKDPVLLLYLIARCVKGAVRYNSEGGFNQSADKRRLGIHPDRLRENLLAVSCLLRGRTAVSARPYVEVLQEVSPEDVVYLDPPYQGVCTGRDSRYAANIEYDSFIEALRDLNARGVPFALSYDGRTGSKSYGQPLPLDLNLALVELDAGVSSQATLLGREEQTVESLYLSPSLLAITGPKGKSPSRVSQPELELLHA